ncbi:MAG: hypothetical protein M0Q15_04925 [Nevskia sp.]|nr:hypothetical protein [Nevskia sp.]
MFIFLLSLSAEKDNLCPDHYRALAKQIIDNYENYLDELLCLTACDFIARNYPFTTAKDIFNRLAPIEKKKPETLRGYVEDGLRILAAEEKRELERIARKAH